MNERPIEATSSSNLDDDLIDDFNNSLFVGEDGVPRRAADQKTIESIVAEDMNNLSLKDRELIYEEVHGVEKPIEETTTLVADSLYELEQELNAISIKPAYNQAEIMNYAYVHNSKFRLVFLRAEYFNPKQAAIRLVRFLEGKLKYFGPDSLTRPLLLSDLDEDDRKTLKSGIIQLWPSRDRAGRAIISDAISMYPRSYKYAVNMAKVFLYTVLTSAEDEETQKRGLVGVYFHMGKLGHQVDTEIYTSVMAATRWLPVRYNASHVCTDRPFMPMFLRAALHVAPASIRSRNRIHEGTHTECQYTLMTFGIPIELCPITFEGELKTTNHLKWIKKRQAKDDIMKMCGVFNKIDMPGVKDILVGKGKPFQQHQGNVHLRQLVALHLSEYAASKKSGKMRMTRELVQFIKARSARFLRKDQDGWWSEVSDVDAREKVSKTFGSTLVSSKSIRIEHPDLHLLEKDIRAKKQKFGCFGVCGLTS